MVLQSGDGGDGVISESTWQLVDRQRRRCHLIIGNGSDSCLVKGVERKVALHVSRIHPKTKL
ncbi:unnamed protein product [Acanthoscelides obtectus]|uniref:Uncharacterized protein n=1 Tax=Acanthoscelides obtectus TaxID=200917 RepID=A0A9P0KX88_ACAOB|nr:unnamed protein product [Acanthoscelides obtectus]CAK1665987.1 hypothetical protein AOBTE_LOCUS25096 [Acanthoscelides obtectus]